MLRGAALRVTRPRVAVLAAVHDHPHADTDSIIGAVRRDSGDVSHQAVYDVLRALTEAGLVRRIQPTGSVARYEARVGDNHHHLVCRSCGAIADVDCAVGDSPCLTASDDAGFADRRGRGHLLGPVPRHAHRSSDTKPSQTGEQRRDRARQREREPGDPVAPSPGAPAEDEPGLVAQPAGPVGPAPALAPRQPAGRELRLQEPSSRASTSRRSSATSPR